MNNIDEIEDEVMDNSLPSRPLYPYEEVPEEKPMGLAWTVDYDSDFFPDDQDSGDDVYVSQSLSLSAQTSDEMPPSGTQPCTSSKSDSDSDSSPNEIGMIDDIITTQPLVVSAQIPDEILPHITHPIKTALIEEFRNRTMDGILRSLSGSVCDLILSNNLDQNDVLRIYRGPKSIEKEKDPMAFSAPEDTHVGLGPTLEEQTSIMNMLLVSKELRHEFQDSLWGGSWYRFNKPHVFDQTVHSLTLYCLPYTKPDGTLSNFNPKILSKVWLSMTNIDYLDFVGFAYEDGRFRLTNKRYLGQSHARGLDLLSKIATLKHLHLEFMVLTPVVGVNQDPFVGQARVEGRHQDGQLVSCQQKFVDMVLTLGYEVFQTFAEVTISGHVKKSNHDTWDLRLGKGTREMLNLDDKVAEYLALRPDEL
ncbi:uncharacterized protein J4E84_006744 [Alternaria hordeiaustralica]|uniref:uncharacterized protein n=1 Tax=Alternaria hordeiaustralica TaxID=1187925 RepID=UPI0020C2A3ED|nr:uncharacterized protein J4E84_006744 [Alternaria hordeiaustralica]KAI4683904.1 hypothetical protein J4E84_006744 [Alternaria hordeiaustralica]